MAKIDLEQKRSRGLGWVWALVAILAVGVLAWWFVAGPESDDVSTTAEYAQGQELATATDTAGQETAEVQGEYPYGDDTIDTAPGTTPGTDTTATADGTLRQSAGVTTAEIVRNPGAWADMPFEGEVRVTEVPSEGGFWIADTSGSTDELFVVVEGEVPSDLNAGSTLRLDQAMIRNGDQVADLDGLDDATRRILETEEVYLVVDGSDVHLSAG